MKASSQVCTLEQAKKLKELGIEQDGIFAYLHYPDAFSLRGDFQPADTYRLVLHRTLIGEDVSAWTVAELGVMLPPFFPSFVQDGRIHCHCENARIDTFPLVSGQTQWDKTPAHELNEEMVPPTTGNSEAEARANMLIYLLENNYLTPADCNTRLAAA